MFDNGLLKLDHRARYQVMEWHVDIPSAEKGQIPGLLCKLSSICELIFLISGRCGTVPIKLG